MTRFKGKHPMHSTSIKHLSLAIFSSLSLMACQPAPDTTTQDSANQEAIAQDSTAQSTNSAQNNSQSAEQTITQPITILALGDSLTEGLGVAEQDSYPAQLEAALHEAGYVNAKVVNSGLSGETSTGLVNRLDWVMKTKPDITILTTGANDAMRGIEVAMIEKNIRTAIERLQAGGSTVILGGMQVYDNMGNEYVKSFSDIYPRIAEDTGVAFIPFFLDGVAADRELNQDDAIHPTKDGYTIIVNDNILPVLKPTLAQVLDSNQSSPDTQLSTATTAETS
ncbi:arylesterase [Psychrobacter pygoscelis]|uniref:arylesterase n=1 Tax=Psychrobacter pygoscelis TaxID=2488563 RepID=UPI001F605B27|nr:arylesterase [Psychrobacter pygoscelis]